MNYLLIGKFIKPWGLKGDLKTLFYVDSIDILECFSAFYIYEEKTREYKTIDIENIKQTAHGYLVKLSGFNDRTAVEILHNINIYVDEDELPKLKENEFYIRDLLDCDIIYQNEYFGTLYNIIDVAGKPVIIVKMNNGKELAIPMNKTYVDNIQIKEKKVFVKSISDLM